MFLGASGSFLESNGPTTFGSKFASREAGNEQVAQQAEEEKNDLSPLNVWFLLKGQPDFRPLASRNAKRKRQENQSPKPQENESHPIAAKRVKKVASNDNSTERMFSSTWSTWYNQEEAQVKLEKRFPELERLRMADQQAKTLPVTMLSTRSSEETSHAVTEFARSEVEKSRSFEAILAESLKNGVSFE